MNFKLRETTVELNPVFFSVPLTASLIRKKTYANVIIICKTLQPINQIFYSTSDAFTLQV